MVQEVKIKDMRMLVTPYPAFVSKETSADEIAKTLIANPELKSVYVVDDKLRLDNSCFRKTFSPDESLYN